MIKDAFHTSLRSTGFRFLRSGFKAFTFIYVLFQKGVPSSVVELDFFLILRKPSGCAQSHYFANANRAGFHHITVGYSGFRMHGPLLNHVRRTEDFAGPQTIAFVFFI